MRLFQKPIFTGFMPNLLTTEVFLGLRAMLPWNWPTLKKGIASKEVETHLKTRFEGYEAITFDSGRTSLNLLLQAFGIQKNDEVLLQAYTCSVVSNAILWSGATPIYVDITKNLHLDPEDLEKKITPKTKVLIIQHTFGIPANMEAILPVAKRHNLKVIEDCAHVFGGTVQGKKLGTFGDAAIVSFGADKPISCGRGGAVLVRDKKVAQMLRTTQNSLSDVSFWVITQQLLTFFLFWMCKPMYHFGGKFLLFAAKQSRVLSKIIEKPEKRGEPVSFYPKKLPNIFAKIVLHQLKHIDRFNQHRHELTLWYTTQIRNNKISLPPYLKNAPEPVFLLRFPIFIKDPQTVCRKAKQEGILLGDWYSTVIAPKDADLLAMKYTLGTCPKAEKLAAESCNLPTDIHITKKDAHKIIRFINSI